MESSTRLLRDSPKPDKLHPKSKRKLELELKVKTEAKKLSGHRKDFFTENHQNDDQHKFLVNLKNECCCGKNNYAANMIIFKDPRVKN